MEARRLSRRAFALSFAPTELRGLTRGRLSPMDCAKRSSAPQQKSMALAGKKFKVDPKAETIRIGVARRLLRLAFEIVRRRGLYEPVEIGGRLLAGNRETDQRWAAIARIIEETGSTSLLDLGCAEGRFLRRAAVELGCFAIGVDMSPGSVLVGEIARLHDGVDRVAIMKARLDPEDVAKLPSCDVVICLSVLHHVIRKRGLAVGKAFLAALTGLARKAAIIEVGRIDILLRDGFHAGAPPAAPADYVRALMSEAGLSDIRLVATTDAVRQNDVRLLFVGTPPGAAQSSPLPSERASFAQIP
jgi:2-polyprenyl-3-methyl-5-hydroxy-6-metoxy-1,4-benzoquinol methylase